MEGTEELKQPARVTWSAGDYDEIATRIWAVGGDLVERVAIADGERVLDVACGSGNAAIPAAAAGARVSGLDITPELFEAGRRRAAEAGVEIEWVEADAERLPFEDGSSVRASQPRRERLRVRRRVSDRARRQAGWVIQQLLPNAERVEIAGASHADAGGERARCQ